MEGKEVRWLSLLTACAIASATPAAALASYVHAVVASEGRYAIYTGAADGTEIDFIGGNTESAGPGGAILPEHYTFEMEDQRYVYVAVWAAPSAARGLLTEFLFNDVAVLSGDPAWQVYPTVLEMDANDDPPTTADVSLNVRRANRRYAWAKAAVISGNGPDTAAGVVDINAEAAWMWRPAEEGPITYGGIDPPSDRVCVIFRIAPNEIWPEIELYHGRNVGTGPSAGATFNPSGRYRRGGGGGGSGGSSGGIRPRGTGTVSRVPNPFPNFDPPNSHSIPPDITPPEPSKPVIPPDDEPDIPEPGTAMMTLVVAGWMLRRR